MAKPNCENKKIIRNCLAKILYSCHVAKLFFTSFRRSVYYTMQKINKYGMRMAK